jgi:hypothetical protein
MGDKLLALPSIYEQVSFAQREFSRLFLGGHPVFIRLIEDFKPLPHMGSTLNEQIELIKPSDCLKEMTKTSLSSILTV